MRKKLVIRTDDLGYTKVHDMGAFETYVNGYSTHAEVMLDSPGTVEALKKLKEFPWISIGWHTHFWNSPVFDPSEVKTLVIPGTNRFRHDLRTAEDVDYDEILREMRAQLDRCVDIIGRAPDVSWTGKGETPFGKAMAKVNEEYGMACDYASRLSVPDGKLSFCPTDEKWKKRKIYVTGFDMVCLPEYETLKELEDNYDPVAWLLDGRCRIDELSEGATLMHGFHPGYVDYYVAREGDFGSRMRYYTLSRTYDVEALCSKRLHDWIKENDIELCNLRDALYGTRDYQNHLRRINSDLCVI